MNSISLIGMAAAFCTTCAFVPQVVHILRTGNVDGISLGMYSLFTLGVLLWLIYGVALNDLPIILANGVTLVLAATVLSLTLHKKRQSPTR